MGYWPLLDAPLVLARGPRYLLKRQGGLVVAVEVPVVTPVDVPVAVGVVAGVAVAVVAGVAVAVDVGVVDVASAHGLWTVKRA